MSTEDKLRVETEMRIGRETAYILELAKLFSKGKAIKLLREKVEDNDKTLMLIGEFLEARGDEWEKFYNERYWKGRGGEK